MIAAALALAIALSGSASAKVWVAPHAPPAPVAAISHAPPAPQPPPAVIGVIPGMPSSLSHCIAFRESTNGQASSNVYQIEQPVWNEFGGTGSPFSASIAEQDMVAGNIYRAQGIAPWGNYDGC